MIGKHCYCCSSLHKLLVPLIFLCCSPFIHAEAGPDLSAEQLDAGAVRTEPQTLLLSGTLAVTLKNGGDAPAPANIAVTAFSDTNLNGAYDAGIDASLGEALIENPLAAAESITLDIAVNGQMPFRDAPITVWADSAQSVAESDEENNFSAGPKPCGDFPASGALEPVLKWERNGGRVAHAPITGPLLDTDGNGTIDEHDTPAVIVLEGYSLAALDGKTGAVLWRNDRRFRTFGVTPALGDLDGDGKPEIVAYLPERKVIALNNDGTEKWVSEAVFDIDTELDFSGLAIADLDADGQAEILAANIVLNADGSVKWAGSQTPALTPIAADLDKDGSPEVLAGQHVYRADGTPYWRFPSRCGFYFAAIADFDGDAYPEIISVTAGKISLFEHDGTLKWGSVDIAGVPTGNPPLTADLDGDGTPEIGIGGTAHFRVFNSDGSLKWQNPVFDPSGTAGASVFDFEADGRAEIVYQDAKTLYIFAGDSGEVLFETPNTSATWIEYPVIADIDNDGHADLLAANSSGIRAFQDAAWAGARGIWNQHAYHITNVDNDGGIPLQEENSFFVYNSYRSARATAITGAALPDLSAGYLRFIDNGSGQPAALQVRIGNAGAAPSPAELSATFYTGDPASGGSLLGTVPLGALEPGAWQDILLDGIETGALAQDIYALADADNRLSECSETNNSARLAAVDAPGEPDTCVIERFDGQTQQWLSAAIGDTAAGSFSIADGRMQVSGSGAKGLWRNDDFYYVYREAAGDFRIETNISAIPVNEGGAHRKAGLMLRSGIGAAKGRDARLMINLVPNHPADSVSNTEYTALQFAWRKKDGKNGGRRLADNVPASLPVRVAIEKRGDVYAAYYSEDSGVTWNQPAGGEANGQTSIDMGDSVLAGMGAASYAADTRLTAEFDSFSLCALPPPPTPRPRECDAEDRPLDMVYLLDLSGSMAKRYGKSKITKLAAAKKAISILNLALAERDNGSRAALISFRGYRNIEKNLNDSAQVQSDFSDGLSRLSELAQSLEIENKTYSATALGLRRALEFLQDAHDPAHRPMLVWLTDGVPNIDGKGNMDGYSARQVAKVSLYDAQGSFLPHPRVAWSGGWNSALDVYYGKPLADAMIAIEQLKSALPELLIYPVAMQGNGKPGSFSADLLEYAAWQSGASVFGADSADALQAAMLELFADATCSTPVQLADLAVSVEGPAQTHTGNTVTYTVTVRNHGPFDAEEVLLDTSLPAGTALASITPEQGACDESAHCELGLLKKGTTVKAELRLTIHEPGLLTGVAAVSGLWTRDPNPADNSANTKIFAADPPAPAPSACITDDFGNSGGTWLEASVGAAAGSFGIGIGRLQVSGSGAELWKNDDFYYVYREVADDFRMEADIVDIPVNQGGMHRKAGLMIRAGIDAAKGRDARIMVNLAPNHPADSVSDTEYTALQFGLRGSKGKSGGRRLAANVPVELPVRIAIEKNGDTYGVFWSEDGGETWLQPPEGGTVRIDMGERLLAGMGAVSYAADTQMTAEFDNFGICESPPPPPPAERQCPAQQRPLDVLYLLDTSGSMFWKYAGGGTKFAAAKEAMLALNTLLVQRADGSRAAVMTFDGYSSPEENLSGAVLLHQEFSADLDAVGSVIAGLRMEDRPSKTAAALALQKALALLQGARDPAHQPLLAWFSDGVPTVDAQGRNEPYWSEEIESIRLYDTSGGFLSRQETAWRGLYNRDAGVYAGQALADAMEALERLQSSIDGLLIYPVAIQGDEKTAGTFSEDLLNYAAWRTGTPVFSADNADDLNAAMPALLADSACTGVSSTRRAAVNLPKREAFGELRKALAATGLPLTIQADGRLETAEDGRGRRYVMRLGTDAKPAPALPSGLISAPRGSGFAFVYRNEAGEKHLRRIYPASAHPRAVYAAGNESLHLKEDGTLAVTLDGQRYRGVFGYQVTAGPADGLLTLTALTGEAPLAFLLKYPDGDRQKIFMLPHTQTAE